ncbi:hypothetical protein Psyr_0148 [Pseudomonas syringae pv. syringae B728a]|uniref:Uncharacterized protein n=2 Tax=Pseudomonas syringae TaxID=317 RepID=A0AAJ4B322_PSESX|nr:hypothetical protein Psyr_0148 [Pseudomonas syringae pv. syringae B728a]PYD12030.1 hypothetical protein DND47_24095 [Pseudomonas syringae pv. syringae]QHF06035.1 hypothetical protein N026_00360 [Pseudomonas syringae UB303]
MILAAGRRSEPGDASLVRESCLNCHAWQSTSTAWLRASRFDPRKRAFYVRKPGCVNASLREQVRSYALRAEAKANTVCF